MIEQADFHKLAEQAMTIPGRKHMRPVIEKELLHYDILFALEKEGLLDKLTFQGGTSLRLCYNGSRFSEDLDFTGGRAFACADLIPLQACIEHYIGQRYQLDVTVKTPKELRNEPEYRGLKVDKWQIAVVTAPEKKHMPKQKIKIEIANIPSYSREPLSLVNNYDFLPDGYQDIFIMTQSLDELMADKLVSLVDCQKYVRYRDIWDLRWLKQKGATINIQWITNKLNDYGSSNYLELTLASLPAIVHSETFRYEMSRFIPKDVQQRTLDKDKFYDFLTNEIKGLLQEVGRLLGKGTDDEFVL